MALLVYPGFGGLGFRTFPYFVAGNERGRKIPDPELRHDKRQSLIPRPLSLTCSNLFQSLYIYTMVSYFLKVYPPTLNRLILKLVRLQIDKTKEAMTMWIDVEQYGNSRGRTSLPFKPKDTSSR